MKAVTTLDKIKDGLLSLTWAPAISMARTTVLRMFAGLEEGRLLIIDETIGAVYTFGQPLLHNNGGKVDAKSSNSLLNVRIAVRFDSFWLRLLLFADVGFAESCMLGEIECDDLVSFFRVCTSPTLCNLLSQGTTQPFSPYL